MSSPARGTWIEIQQAHAQQNHHHRRPPLGGRGLKLKMLKKVLTNCYSRPPLGGRGLKYIALMLIGFALRRPPLGGRGLKCQWPPWPGDTFPGRPPLGGRGLKFCALRRRFRVRVGSSPARGTWIEMAHPGGWFRPSRRRPPLGGRGLKYRPSPGMAQMQSSSPARGTWIEIRIHRCQRPGALSSPARGTWIEIASMRASSSLMAVVPRSGDVD